MLPYFDDASSIVCFESSVYFLSLLSEVVNAISFELGDQLNENFSESRSLIFCGSPIPSAVAIYISSRPLRSLTKAIHLPSGEYPGSLSRAGLSVI